jgi:hypothetical protein
MYVLNDDFSEHVLGAKVIGDTPLQTVNSIYWNEFVR